MLLRNQQLQSKLYVLSVSHILMLGRLRNLFAKEYCAKNQVTKAEFDIAWDTLGEDKKQVSMIGSRRFITLI